MKDMILSHLSRGSDWHVDETGVFSNKLMKDEQISFPSEVFECNHLQDFGKGWWSTHRNLILLKSLQKYNVTEILEVGAGNGGVANFLNSKGLEIVCLEPHLKGARQIASRGILAICGFLHEMDLPENSIPSIGLFDVLEHIEDPKKVLLEIHRVLDNNSRLFIMVPAHQFLFSKFDEQIGHFRRYSRSELKKELQDVGFEIIETRSMFITLLPGVIIQRLILRISSSKRISISSVFASKTSCALNPNKKLNQFLLGVLSWERVFNAGRKLPGVSLMIVAQKRAG